MNKKNSGVTLINLVVMIALMLVLISITGYYSLGNVKNSYIARQKREFANVVEYVSLLRAKLINEEFEISPDLTPISSEALVVVGKPLSDTAINAIEEVNAAEALNRNYKYYYLTPEIIGNKTYSDGFITVKSAKNRYIVNYFTGTVIAFYDDESCEISGLVKGLTSILNELN